MFTFHRHIKHNTESSRDEVKNSEISQRHVIYDSSTGSPSKRKMRASRGLRFRSLIPAIIGVSLGFALSMIYIPVVEQQCLFDLEESQVLILGKQQSELLKNREKKSTEQKRIAKNAEPVSHKTIPPKATYFNMNLRPFYVASELGHREKLLVGVLTSEERLDSLVLAINNTWAPGLPKVIFFTPYSRDAEFHEKYNKVLGLPVVQLVDIEGDDSTPKITISFKMLKYMHDHYINNYEWFMRAEDTMYMKPEKLLEFLNGINSSRDLYIGHPSAFGADVAETKEDLYSHQRYCQGAPGVVLSRSALARLSPNLESCLEEALSDEEDIELGRCLYRNVGIQCSWSYEIADLFYHIPKKSEFDVAAILKDRKMAKVISIAPIHSPLAVYQIHRYYSELELNKTFVETRALQTAMKDLLPYLPDGVMEKKSSWPVGYFRQFRPQSRFEVIQWQYFTEHYTYGYNENNPKVKLVGDHKRDIDDVCETAKKMLTREPDYEGVVPWLVNGYRRVDPWRGAEYILDIGLKKSSSEEEIRRVHLLRPLTRVESVQMPTATEQRGIHLVLPVTHKDTNRLGEFLHMYQRVCLQTGENVVLLTVFVNIRTGPTADPTNQPDKFASSKEMIARYKQKYTWAQLPWIQIGVKYNSLKLLMDIVTMKLPANALIFLTSLGMEFSINFLNRCRVNALNGEQVFFPIPFVFFNNDIVSRYNTLPDHIVLHRDTGHWDETIHDQACFNNKDYKENRIHSDSFLKEERSPPKALMDVFLQTNLQVFRAVDVDLRKQYQPLACHPQLPEDKYSACLAVKGEGLASSTHLARLLFEKEEEEKNRTK